MKKFIKKITHTAKSAVTCVKTAAVNSMSAVLAFNRRAVCSNAGEGYIDTAVKVLIAVVLGALVLAGLYAMSESKMKKLFKSVYNMSITEYIQRKRISVAEHMLIQTDLTIAEISRIVGYSNPSRLIEIFKRYYGFTPSKYRK